METSLPIEKYKKIRMAQAEGARTVEDLRRMTDLVIENEEEAKEMQRILKNACGCNNVSVEEVARAVRNGADTVEKLQQLLVLEQIATNVKVACFKV